MNPDKKISFGFSKLIKKQNISTHSNNIVKTVELVDCLEGSEIKVKNPIEKVENLPLIIPIRGNANNLVGRIERESLKNKRKEFEKEQEDTRSDSELTIEELAARQLLREARNRLNQDKDTIKVHTLPLKDDNIEEDGEEPTLEDYEKIPIEGYGLAILRGMGWKEGMGIGRNHSKATKPIQPEMRPKGLGLGAQKMVNLDTKDVFDKNGKQLILMKGSFAKIIAGSHKGNYCEIQGLNEESGRIIVKISKTNEILSLNELFLVPISKEDHSMGLKVLNNIKYEKYKEQEDNKKKNSYTDLNEESNRYNNSQETEKNEEHNTFSEVNFKTEKDCSTHDYNSFEMNRKFKESSSENEYTKKRLKIKDEKQSTSKYKSDEKRYSSKRHSNENEKHYFSDNCSSEDSYYCRKNNVKNKGACDSSSDCSSSSDDKSNRNKRSGKESKKYKKDWKHTSDSKHTRDSKKECRSITKSTKYREKKRDSSRNRSKNHKKYRSEKN